MRVQLLIWLVVLSSTTAFAGSFYVDSVAGNDSGPGTSPAQAWKTLAKVSATRFQAGDQILLARGRTWFEQLLVSSSGAPGSPITLTAYGEGQPPLIDAQGIRNRGISIVGKSYVVVDQLAIQNSTSYAIEVFNSSHVTITNCAIRNAKQSAISVGGRSPDVRIDACSYSQDPGLTTASSFVSIFSPVEGAVVSNNKVSGFTGRIAISFLDVNNAVAFGNVLDGGGIGIAINACSRNLTGGQIHDNVISNISTAQGDGEAIELTGHVGATNAHCEQDKAHPFPVTTVSGEIYNNKIQGGPETFGGIDGWHAVQSRVHDNQISNFQKYGMQWTADSTGNEFFHNEIRECGVAAIAIYGGKGNSSASIHHNTIEGANVGISADAGANVEEDFNTMNQVRSARSGSISAGRHTTVTGSRTYQ
jgi:hypothetical protein